MRLSSNAVSVRWFSMKFMRVAKGMKKPFVNWMISASRRFVMIFASAKPPEKKALKSSKPCTGQRDTYAYV